MLDIEFPWWLIALIYLFAFMMYFGWGALLGFILTLAVVSEPDQEGKSRSRARKLSTSLLGALGGGGVNFAIVWVGLSGPYG